MFKISNLIIKLLPGPGVVSYFANIKGGQGNNVVFADKIATNIRSASVTYQGGAIPAAGEQRGGTE
jgi:hypothetical protein